MWVVAQRKHRTDAAVARVLVISHSSSQRLINPTSVPEVGALQ